MKKLFVLGIISLMVVLGTAVVQAQPSIVVDSFDSGEQSLRQRGIGVEFENKLASEALGGYRKLRVENFVSGLLSRVDAEVILTDGGFSADVLQIGVTDSTQYLVTVIWDGDNNTTWDGESIAYTGLGGVDLVYDNVATEQVADGVLLSIVGWEGNAIDIRITIYTNELNYSEATYRVRGDNFIEPYDVSLCFFEGCFVDAGSEGGADFRNVGAVVMEVRSIEQGADITLSLTFTGPARDYGDLPDSYTTLLGVPNDVPIPSDHQGGPRHSRGNIYLGTTISTELNARGPLDGTGDGVTDDGVKPVGTDGPRWQNGVGGGAVEITWLSPFNGGLACLDGWINWHHDAGSDTNTFEVTTATVNGNEKTYTLEDKHVVRGLVLNSNDLPFTRLVTFPVPEDFFDDGSGNFNELSLASRWRIYPADATGNCPAGGIDYFGYIINGEVEDYIWGFSPTAVTLQLMNANTATPVLPVTLAALLLFLVSFGALIYRRQMR